MPPTLWSHFIIRAAVAFIGFLRRDTSVETYLLSYILTCNGDVVVYSSSSVSAERKQRD